MTEFAAVPSAASRRAVLRTALARFAAAFVVLGGAWFGIAGTFRYWQAWATLVALFVPIAFAAGWMARSAPDLLERRMRTRERESAQRAVLALGIPVYVALLVGPALDRRFGWSSVPAAVSIAAQLLLVAGYAVSVLVMRENHYASHVVEVERGQRVVSTGPYALVRHPMYSGISVMFSAFPLALGSWWFLLASPALVAVFVARIRNEEKVLVEGLAGYREYREKVRFRLVPGIW